MLMTPNDPNSRESVEIVPAKTGEAVADSPGAGVAVIDRRSMNLGDLPYGTEAVAVSVPSVVGPYTSINCTLTLQHSSVRISPQKGSKYQRDPANADPRWIRVTRRPTRLTGRIV